MIIKSLEILNFRNIKNAKIEPSKEINIISGENAQGKTNLIEAIWFFTGAKSFRGTKDSETIKKGEENAIPEGIRKMPWGTMYSVPYRALINNQVTNLITVGRCISAEFEAVGALRVSPMAGATGHAGGVAASLAAKKDGNVHNVDIKELQKVLKEQKAYLEL